MQPEIKRHDPETEYLIPEGCHITELSNTGSDPALSIALARVLPGETTRWHSVKDTSERYVILSGEGRVEIGDLPAQRLHPHDVALIPAGCRQRITNTGDTDLIFLALCTPRFEAGNYEDRESAEGDQSQAVFATRHEQSGVHQEPSKYHATLLQRS